jgi:DNA-binding PucR family transcriptional regulator
MLGSPLDELLDGVVGSLLLRVLPPPGGWPRVVGLAVLDPHDDPGDHHGELIVLVGVRGRSALAMVESAARSGAVAVAVKPDGEDASGELVAPARRCGVALLLVRPETRWDRLGTLLRERLELTELVDPADGGPVPAQAAAGPAEDLFALAEATAAVTGGIVSIEDVGNRMLAYSRSDDEVDELRRLSILGWQGPESYMRMLREWGVLDRLRGGQPVVPVDARPDLGILARLAAGIRVGPRYLGTVWVQQRRAGAPFAERAEEALAGAARLAATEILRRHAGLGPAGTGARLAELLSGRANTDLVAGRLGLDPGEPAVLVGFGGPVEADEPVRELHLDQLRTVVSVYASAYHRVALVGEDGPRVYLLLPGVRSGPGDRALRSWLRDAVEVAAGRTGLRWWAGVSEAPRLSALPSARAEADRVLDALSRSGPDGPVVAGMSELRTELLLDELAELLQERRPELRNPGVSALLAHDRDRGGALAGSLLAYLDALGDVRAAAETLHVHPNTLRHRVRRARVVSGLDLDDPRQRLAAHLQLALTCR